MKRGAIELSLNFLVVIIISIVLLVGGLTIFFKMKGNADSFVKGIDSQTDDRLKNIMLNTNAKVSVYPNDLELDNGKSKLIGIGINNVYDSSMNYSIVLSPVDATPASIVKYYPTPSSSASTLVGWTSQSLQMSNQKIDVKPLSQSSAGILVTMPKNAPSGQYVVVFKVERYTSPLTKEPYGVAQVYIYNP